MKTTLDLQPRTEVWDTYMGCLEGCLAYLGSGVSPAWLYGVGGHAFGLNIHEQLCPSGPHVWSGWGTLQGREALLGLSIERLGPWYRGHDDQYQEHKQFAWDRTRAAIDASTPCIGYDLSWAEFYVVHGYDETGYYFWKTDMGAMDETGPLPWEQLGEVGGVHMIDVQYLSAVEPPADDREVVRAALQWAVRFGAQGDADDPQRNPAYASGLAAYDEWLTALDDPGCWEGRPIGAMYNAQVWRECRRYAVQFLTEARDRLADDGLAPLFDAAIGHYGAVETALGSVCDQFWFESPDSKRPAQERHERAAAGLTAARDAEQHGLAELQRVVDAL